jgi:acyl-CoA synthetase (AMP-forming)/AMP-acid ligase II/acyl carrier protein
MSTQPMPRSPYAPDASTLVELLRWRAAHEPDRVAYTFLEDGEQKEQSRTHAELDRRARAVSAWLQNHAVPGDRALMMFEEGLEYLDALFGCMYASVLAVPVHPPDPMRLHRTVPRLLKVAEDAAVRCVLTTKALRDSVSPLFATRLALADARWLCLDELEDNDTPESAASSAVSSPVAADLAYLQYTSGSTAEPKGVMISHGNLLHQLADFDLGYDHRPDSVLVTWLPATHDLGLVYGRLMPLYIGFRCVFMSPTSFMQRPARWMEAISRYRGTHSPSPNFGFELAARKVPDLASLDLRHVQVLLNGAEPIRQESEERFAAVFAAAGLPASAVTHAMGMSEATAKIMTEPPGRHPPKFVHIDGAAYERDEVVLVSRDAPGSRTVASNGFVSGDTRVIIVHPESREVLPEDRVGEMWVSGTTVAQGYWNNSAATEATFRAHTADGQGPFLRTGDLAFIHEQEIYLSGRLKDVIIIRGQNHHPQDIEWTVATAHAALRPNCAASFGVPSPSGEQLVLVTEVYEDRISDPAAIFAAIRAAVAEHGLAARSIALLPARGLPKTSSGKIQRGLARRQFVEGLLPILVRWDAPEVAEETPVPESVQAGADPVLMKIRSASPRKRLQLITAHLQEVAAGLLGQGADEIEVDRPFGELGLDSVTAVEMVERVGKTLGVPLAGTQLFDHPTIERLAEHLAEQLQQAQST